MLCRKFELIPIKIRFLQIFKVAPKLGKSPCTIVQGRWPNFTKNEIKRILHFYKVVDKVTQKVRREGI